MLLAIQNIYSTPQRKTNKFFLLIKIAEHIKGKHVKSIATHNKRKNKSN